MRFVKIIFGLLFLVIVVGAGAAVWFFSAIDKPLTHSKSGEYIRIEKGVTPGEIVSRLSAEGILPGGTISNIYLRLFVDSNQIQAGEYLFPSPITMPQVFRQLEKGEDRTIKLTIPEGFTRFDIAKRIVEKFPRTPAVTEAELVALMDDTSLIRDISPTAKNLEGYMYPTTYNVARDATSAEIIKQTVEQFRKFWKPEWSEAARSMGRTPHEIVTIASLVETETSVEAERPIVAGVINNRLARNIPLGIDQTNVYIAKMMGRWDGTINKSDLEVDSPYNTRIKTGVPPGPISSVTESSIRAAVNPSPNDYIFYVRNVDLNDGSHWFYATGAEFEKGKAKYQEWLEKERVMKRAGEANL
ncbi:MAG: endolytic transglycosylase MltG [Pyrinomonadaceae bacterium]